MANQEVDLSFMTEFRVDTEITPETHLWIAGVAVPHQIETQITSLYRGTCNLKIKRMVVPTPVMDCFMQAETVSFKLVSAHGKHVLEGDCCLDTCVEGGSSDHFRALENVVLTIRPK